MYHKSIVTGQSLASDSVTAVVVTDVMLDNGSFSHDVQVYARINDTIHWLESIINRTYLN